MDNLTHSLFGWTLARAGLGRHVPHATATLIIASNAPDVDVFAGLRSGVDYLAVHRGPTHGPLGVVGLGLMTAGIVSVWSRLRSRSPDSTTTNDASRQFLKCSVLAMVAVTCHVLMDLPTSYGTRLFSPFVWSWYALDWMPIIDIYLWIVLIGALIVGMRTRREQAAAIALGFLVFDYSARAALHHRALTRGASFNAAGVRAPCAAAPTFVVHSGGDLAAANGPPACIEAAALPTFVSPFTFRIIRKHPNGYELSDRKIFEDPPAVPFSWIANASGPEVDRVRTTRAGRVYLDFARFPVAEVSMREPSATSVRLFDARFIVIPAGPGRGPFGARLAIVVLLNH